MWLCRWLGSIFSATPLPGLDVTVTDSIVNFVFVVTSLVLLDFGRDLGSWIGRKIWITKELEFKEVLDWLLEGSLYLAHDMT